MFNTDPARSDWLLQVWQLSPSHNPSAAHVHPDTAEYISTQHNTYRHSRIHIETAEYISTQRNTYRHSTIHIDTAQYVSTQRDAYRHSQRPVGPPVGLDEPKCDDPSRDPTANNHTEHCQTLTTTCMLTCSLAFHSLLCLTPFCYPSLDAVSHIYLLSLICCCLAHCLARYLPLDEGYLPLHGSTIGLSRPVCTVHV